MSQKTYVGIMYGGKRYKQISNGNVKLMKKLSFFEEAAQKNGVSLCYFRLIDIEPGRYYIKAYVLGEKGYELKEVPRPPVIYHRRIDRKKVRPKIQALIKDGITIFNERNQGYGKLPIWTILSQNSKLSKQLPFTLKATENNIKTMMEKYNSLILKPNLGAVGRGLMKIEKMGGEWCLSYTEKSKTSKTRKEVYFQSELPDVLIKIIKSRFYIVQERINLATYNNSPFDMRVAVQRNNKGEWETTAFIVKVAKKGHFVTNVGQGGTTYPLQTILKQHPHLSYNKVSQDISNFTLNIAEHLSEVLPHIGSLGMDIGITNDGIPYCIEVNYLNDFATLVFRNNELVFEEWKKVFTTPIDYASYLVKKNNTGISESIG